MPRLTMTQVNPTFPIKLGQKHFQSKKGLVFKLEEYVRNRVKSLQGSKDQAGRQGVLLRCLGAVAKGLASPW